MDLYIGPCGNALAGGKSLSKLKGRAHSAEQSVRSQVYYSKTSGSATWVIETDAYIGFNSQRSVAVRKIRYANQALSWHFTNCLTIDRESSLLISCSCWCIEKAFLFLLMLLLTSISHGPSIMHPPLICNVPEYFLLPLLRRHPKLISGCCNNLWFEM